MSERILNIDDLVAKAIAKIFIKDETDVWFRRAKLSEGY